MYESFYNLREKPFNLHPDPDYLFLSQGHDNAITHLEYSITENKGFVVITGEIGSGKTTLINYFLNKISQDIHIGLINNTYAPHSNFIRLICQEFELDVAGKDRAEHLDMFHEFLIKQYVEKKRVVLIIDEAQNLTPAALEEIRLISNLESEKHYLIQIILVGQPELKYTLQRRELTQFAQRVTVHCHLGSMTQKETDQYIRYRLNIAGSENKCIFQKDAISAVYEYSKGIPRLINILCDTALVFAFADGLKRISSRVIENVIKTREAGGIFADDTENDEDPPSSPPLLERTASEQPDNRFKFMEQRMTILENMIDNMSRKLDSLSGKKDERDAIIIDLFKMLKSSIETRANTLLQLTRNITKAQNNTITPKKEKTDHRQPFLYRLKRKK